MATFLKIFLAALLVVFLAHAVIGWLRPDVMPGLSFLPGDIKYESPSGKCPRLLPHCDVDSALTRAQSDP